MMFHSPWRPMFVLQQTQALDPPMKRSSNLNIATTDFSMNCKGVAKGSNSSCSNTTRRIQLGGRVGGLIVFPAMYNYLCMFNGLVVMFPAQLGVFGDDTWSAGAHEWDVSHTVSPATHSGELNAPKELYLDLNCFAMKLEPVSDTEFTKRMGVSVVLFI